MTEKKINICGKEVGIAYCYATELTYYSKTGQSIDEYLKEIAPDESGNSKASPEKTLYIILSAIVAYAEYHGEESPVRDNDLMYGATPKDIIEALSAVLLLRNEWYSMPEGIAKPKKGKKGKN